MEYSFEYSVEYSMEYENQQNGIFQKTTTTTLNSIFLEYGISWNIEYFNFSCKNIFFIFDAIWNIPIFCLHNVFDRIFGIWNIPKKMYHNKNMKILEYGIFHEYSKKIVPQQKY